MGFGPDFVRFNTVGYWSIDIFCSGDGVVIQGGDGSVSAHCMGASWSFKFWTKGLYQGSPATLQFYLPFAGTRGLWSGVLMYAIG